MYGTKIGVKERLGLDQEDVSLDDSIDRAIAYADAVIDAAFTKATVTVPATTPQLIIESSNDIAAYYMLKSTNMDLAQKFYDGGALLLRNYLEANVTGLKGGAKVVTTSQVKSDSDS